MGSGDVTLLVGDCREKLAELADNSVDAIVTDPPYELTTAKRSVPAPYVEGSPYSRHRVGVNGDQKPLKGFMGKEWDGSGVAHDAMMWAEALRVLKPGGHILAFGGTRTYHRMVVAIEDAGFEIRDQIGWVYGTGFPKSRDIGEGWGTALKPAWEPICVARKPLVGTVAANVLEHGTGAINIDGCRIGESGARNNGRQAGTNGIYGHIGATEPVDYGKGRWPANIVHDGSDEVVELFPDSKGQQGDLRGHASKRRTKTCFGNMGPAADHLARGDSGSAARFFYCAKASRSERGEHNDHPTVKPIALMRWLCRLITPPGGVVLDPFLGSGTTGIAAAAEGFRFIGCELNPEYVAIAERRLGLDLA